MTIGRRPRNIELPFFGNRSMPATEPASEAPACIAFFVAVIVSAFVGGPLILRPSEQPGRCNAYFQARLGNLLYGNGRTASVWGCLDKRDIVEKVIGSSLCRTFVLESQGTTIRVFSTGRIAELPDPDDLGAKGQLVPAADRQAMATALGVTLDPDQPYAIDVTEIYRNWSKYDGSLSVGINWTN